MWAIVTIGGPIVLGLALAYLVIRNRRRQRALVLRQRRGPSRGSGNDRVLPAKLPLDGADLAPQPPGPSR